METQMKLLFLDIDGVIADYESNGFTTNSGIIVPYGFYPEYVQRLNNVITQTGCKIVVSSDWRNHFGWNDMKEVFEHYGILSDVLFGYTANLPSYNAMTLSKGRADEILNFVNLYRPDKFCAVDDLDLSPWIDPESKFVKTVDGIYEKHENKLIEFLK